MKVVILCGGSGTRLWPISRKTTPKQFAKIFNNSSLFQLTILRNTFIAKAFTIIVGEAQYNTCKSQIEELKLNIPYEFIIEPIGRNTACAIALASFISQNDSPLLILPSDHLISDIEVYEECIKNANDLALKSHLVTFGIKAKYPETGYGYIEANGIDVKSFKEKPSLDLAIKYVAKGNYFWNSGMFSFTSKTYLDALKAFRTDIYETSNVALKNATKKDNTYFIKLEDMEKIPSESIDYAVMEKASDVKVIPSPFSWSDLGSFDSLYEHFEKDEQGNTHSSNTINIESTNNLIIKETERKVSLFNVSDLIIVDTSDALLIGKKGHSQNVKKIVEVLQKEGSKLLE